MNGNASPQGRSLRCLGGDEEAAVAHNLFFALVGFEPDVEAESNHINVGAGAPGGAGVFAVGVAEGDVDAGEFFVLKNVADDALDAELVPMANSPTRSEFSSVWV